MHLCPRTMIEEHIRFRCVVYHQYVLVLLSFGCKIQPHCRRKTMKLSIVYVELTIAIFSMLKIFPPVSNIWNGLSHMNVSSLWRTFAMTPRLVSIFLDCVDIDLSADNTREETEKIDRIFHDYQSLVDRLLEIQSRFERNRRWLIHFLRSARKSVANTGWWTWIVHMESDI